MSADSRSIIGAILSGLLLTLSFPNLDADFLVWFALVPLFFSIRGVTTKRAFYLGFLAGFVHFLTLIYWIYYVIQYYGGLPWYFAAFSLLCLVGYLALFPGVFCYIVTYVTRSSKLPLIAVAPVVWVALELVRSYFLSGFPWELLGESLYRRTLLIQPAAVTGVYGLSLVIVAINTALYEIVFPEHEGKSRFFNASTVTAACLFAWLPFYGMVRLHEAPHPRKTIPVALVQGNIDQTVKWDPLFQQETLDIYFNMTAEALEKEPALVVWPETTLPFLFERDKPLADQVREFVKGAGVSFVLGSPAVETEGKEIEYRNRAFLLGPDGSTLGKYDKSHLVPYGEYVPLKWMFPFFRKLIVAAGNFTPGPSGKVLSSPEFTLGPLICYESIFPEISRAEVRNGAQLLVNITNDAWFGRSSAPYQHFSMLVFRCVETHRWAVRAANTGVSGVIAADGSIRVRSPIFEPYTLVHDAELLDGTTFYVRFGDVFAYGCSLMAVLLIMRSWLTNRRGRVSNTIEESKRSEDHVQRRAKRTRKRG